MPHGPSVLYFTSYETHMLLVVAGSVRAEAVPAPG